VTDSYLYDAWGEALQESGVTPNPYRYVGRLRYYQMPGTGLYHVGHRQLATAAGRFLTVDPARDGGNWYGYVGGRSTVATDARGLQLLERVTPYVEPYLELLSEEAAAEGASLWMRITPFVAQR
jgi:RHS repeat-associated protein